MNRLAPEIPPHPIVTAARSCPATPQGLGGAFGGCNGFGLRDLGHEGADRLDCLRRKARASAAPRTGFKPFDQSPVVGCQDTEPMLSKPGGRAALFDFGEKGVAHDGLAYTHLRARQCTQLPECTQLR